MRLVGLSGRFRFCLLAALIASQALLVAPVNAQTPTGSAAADTTPIHAVLARRAFTGVLGWIGGAAVGGYVGSQIEPSYCGCDDPGLREVMIGFVFGGAIGAGIGAGAPKLQSQCTFAQRVGLGILGSAAGTVIGMISLTHSSRAIIVPIYSVTGATLAQWRC
jgi:hypothetical protein